MGASTTRRTILPVAGAHVTAERRELAIGWHGGQSSMLYAIASTGDLYRGTVRPYGIERASEWDAWLLDALRVELRECLRASHQYAPEDSDALREWLEAIQ